MKSKLKKKPITIELADVVITHKDLIEMCRCGFAGHKSCVKSRHFKKAVMNQRTAMHIMKRGNKNEILEDFSNMPSGSSYGYYT